MEAKAKKSKKTKKTVEETVKTNTPKWEIKDRQYYIKGLGSPLTYVLQSKSTRKKPLLWWDEEKGVNREMRYASNQNSIFMDEQDSNAILEHIIFEDGVLKNPAPIDPLDHLRGKFQFQPERYKRERHFV